MILFLIVVNIPLSGSYSESCAESCQISWCLQLYAWVRGGGRWEGRGKAMGQMGDKGETTTKEKFKILLSFFFFFSFFSFLTWLRGLPPLCSVLTAAALTASFLSLSLTTSPHHFSSTSGQHPFTYWTDTLIHVTLPSGTFSSVTHRNCHSHLSLACCWK